MNEMVENFFTKPSSQDALDDIKLTGKSEEMFDDAGSKQMKEKKMSLNTQEEKNQKYLLWTPFLRGTTWSYIYPYDDPLTGKKKRKWKGGFQSEIDALVDIKQMQSALNKGEITNETNCTVAEYLETWLDSISPRLASNTISGYKSNVNNHIVPVLGQIRLTALLNRDVQRMADGLTADGLSPRTVEYVVRTLGTALRDAIKNRLISYNAAERVVLPQKQEFVPPALLDMEQSKKLIQAAVNSPIELEIVVTATCGTRRGETLGLSISDVDFEKKRIFLHQQVTVDNLKAAGERVVVKDKLKTQKSTRVIYPPDMVFAVIQRRLALIEYNKEVYGDEYHDNGLLCCMSNGDPIQPERLTRRFHNLLRDTGLPQIRFHDLRHSCATNLVSNCCDLESVANLLGHSTVKMTKHYSATAEKPHVAANVFNKLLPANEQLTNFSEE